MNYDKNSFLAGLAAGRQMKGWAGITKSGSVTPSGGMIDALITGDINVAVASNVEKMRPYAFYLCDIPSVSLPNVKAIEFGAFASCHNLASANVPSATKVEFDAFKNCGALVSIDLPKITEIGNEAFYGCSALESANMPLATSIGTGAFRNCEALLAGTSQMCLI